MDSSKLNLTTQTKEIRKVTSLHEQESSGPATKKRLTNEGMIISASPEIGETSQPDAKRKERIDQITHPNDFVAETFRYHGCDHTIKKSTTVNRFKIPTEEQIEAYSQEVVTAVRKGNVQELREMLKAGKCLECCNRFGEGLMHMACRRGYLDIVRFLVVEAKCSLFVRDDYGRTPMHDACWSPKPNFKLMKFLIEQQPELLLMSDVRGHTPYSYARKEHWSEW
eukprot:CAMPEP_0202454934 /NCGR_PEP_ID=MMETSP1360-20130828/12577_1 /ASSEMBLY_ACC=CAM_ASM_000848 /TAXON_ID=515479 /ORGANISM="Licmophora paradoxa, Strain CCMP2313" /LENGTH=223 /DNA_ID=CAMNT_0049074385 /DNA_START=56 /DNA_END=724 /DNA_ORIENTATION=-